jgi:hypothetical protein
MLFTPWPPAMNSSSGQEKLQQHKGCIMAKLFFIGFCISALLYTGCASRLPMVDEMGKPVAKTEIDQKRSTKNFWLFTIGGGALSFGASFFAGSLVDRSGNSDNHTALWIVTGTGTLLGTALFAHTGSVRDFNLALEAVKESRKEMVNQRIVEEQKRQEELATEKRRLEEERQHQEAERQKLLDEIRKKQETEKSKP